MEYIIYLLEFIVFCFLLAATGLVIYFLWYSYQKYREQKMYDMNNYNIRYAHIKAHLAGEETSQDICEYLTDKLIELSQMRYKDRKKTKELYLEFFKKYRSHLKPDDLTHTN